MYKKQILLLIVTFFSYSLFASDSDIIVNVPFSNYEFANNLERLVNVPDAFSEYFLPSFSYRDSKDVLHLLSLNKNIRSTLITSYNKEIYSFLHYNALFKSSKLPEGLRCDDIRTELCNDYKKMVIYKSLLNDINRYNFDSNLFINVDENQNIYGVNTDMLDELYFKKYDFEHGGNSYFKKLDIFIENKRCFIVPALGNGFSHANEFENVLSFILHDLEYNKCSYKESASVRFEGVQFSNLTEPEIKKLLNLERKEIFYFYDKYNKSILDDSSWVWIVNSELFMQIIKKYSLHDSLELRIKVEDFFMGIWDYSIFDEDLYEKIALLLQEGIHPDIHEKDGRTALINACRRENSSSFIDLLISYGADVNFKTLKGETAFSAAVKVGQFETVNLLLENGFDIRVHDEDLNNEDFQKIICNGFKSVFNKDNELTTFFFDNYFGIINKQMTEADIMSLITVDFTQEKYHYLEQFSCFNDQHKNKAFLFACMTNKKNNYQNMDLIKDLLFDGADINSVYSEGNSALMFACSYKDMQLIKFLLEEGANIYLETYQTVFEYVCDRCSLDVVEFWLNHFQNNKKEFIAKNTRALYFGCNREYWLRQTQEVIEALLKYGFDPNIKYNNIQALHILSEKNDIKLAQLLIDCGADVDSVGCPESPLHIAAQYNQVEMIELLLNNGADINRKSGYMQKTPLISACESKECKAIKILIKNGADVLVKDINGNDAERRMTNFTVQYDSVKRGLTEEEKEVLNLIVEKKEEQQELLELQKKRLEEIAVSAKKEWQKRQAFKIKCEVDNLTKNYLLKKYLQALFVTYASYVTIQNQKVHNLNQETVDLKFITSKKINIHVLIHILIKMLTMYFLSNALIF